MNLSTAIFLFDDAGARAIRCEYEPDSNYSNSNKSGLTRSQMFKTLDKSIKKDDLVIVQTLTRHGFTVVKVTEVDVRVDLNSPDQYAWVVGKVDLPKVEAMIAQEKTILDRVAAHQLNQEKAKLREAMGLDKVDLSGLAILHGAIEAIPSPAAPPQYAPPPPASPSSLMKEMEDAPFVPDKDSDYSGGAF